tara:strand:+ start:323 stop:514 length:192 start_codon:yes stop_codon:yes gene_type:complete
MKYTIELLERHLLNLTKQMESIDKLKDSAVNTEELADKLGERSKELKDSIKVLKKHEKTIQRN